MTEQDEARLGGAGTEASTLAFSVDVGDSRSYIRLRGELDESTAALVTCVVDSQLSRGARDVYVDLGELAFFDLRGFSVLCEAHGRLRDAGARLRAAHVSRLFRTVATWWGVPELIDETAPAPTPPRAPDAALGGRVPREVGS